MSDEMDRAIQRMLTLHPGLLDELKEYDRRVENGEDVGEFLPSNEVRRRLGLPPQGKRARS